MIRTASCVLALVALIACGGQPPAPDSTAAAPETAGSSGTAEPAPAGGEDSAPVSTLSSRGTPATGASTAAGIAFEMPDGWQAQPPSSSMRLAQAQIPGPGGPGELTIFFFGVGGGGGVEANLERWIGQMSAASEPLRETFETHGLTVTWVDVKGTLNPSVMGTGPTSPQPDSRLFGAVVEGPGGPWFFKATGPDATLSEQRDAFVEMLQGLAPAS